MYVLVCIKNKSAAAFHLPQMNNIRYFRDISSQAFMNSLLRLKLIQITTQRRLQLILFMAFHLYDLKD